MCEHSRAVARQVIAVLDGAPYLGVAYQPGKLPLALEQRQVAQVGTAMLQQVERHQHRITASAAQRTEVRFAVVPDYHDLTVDQE